MIMRRLINIIKDHINKDILINIMTLCVEQTNLVGPFISSS